MEFTILMPCLNEARTISTCVQQARDFLDREGIQGEVLVADNGSTDGSVNLATQAGARVVRVEQRGYGAALWSGIQAARGQFVIMGDADDSYDFSALQPFVAKLRAGAQLVMGNRFSGGIAPGAMPVLHRWLGNPVLSALGRLFFRLPVGDFHCGLRGFEAEAIRNLHLTSSGMEFATEMVAKSAFAGLRVVEVPTTLRRDGRNRPPHLRTWRDGWRHLRFMLLFSPLWLFIIPGLVLFLVGIVGMLVLWPGALHLGSLGLDVHTMVYCSAACVLGFQALQWGAMVHWLGLRSGMRVMHTGTLISSLMQYARVEFGLLFGFLMFLIGLSWSAWLTSNWIASDFSPIAATGVLRDAIFACTLMIVGVQMIGGSFFAASLSAGIDSGFIRLRKIIT